MTRHRRARSRALPSLCQLVAAWIGVSSASAAQLTLTSLSGPGPFFPGETITLEAGGDSVGAPGQAFVNAAIAFGGEDSVTAVEPSFVGVRDVDWFPSTMHVPPSATPASSGTCSVAPNGRCTSTPGLQDGMHRVIDISSPAFGQGPFDILPGSVLGRVQFVLGGPGLYSFTPVPDETGWVRSEPGGHDHRHRDPRTHHRRGSSRSAWCDSRCRSAEGVIVGLFSGRLRSAYCQARTLMRSSRTVSVMSRSRRVPIDAVSHRSRGRRGAPGGDRRGGRPRAQELAAGACVAPSSRYLSARWGVRTAWGTPLAFAGVETAIALLGAHVTAVPARRRRGAAGFDFRDLVSVRSVVGLLERGVPCGASDAASRRCGIDSPRSTRSPRCSGCLRHAAWWSGTKAF